MGAIQFQQIEALQTKKSLFNLSSEYTTTMDMGQLIPVMMEEAIPSDVWRMSMRMILRFAPLVSPVLHAIYAKTFTFFVPYRLLFPKLKDPTELSDIDHNWENFITGGEDGDDDSSLPLWNPPQNERGIGSLWDYMTLPIVNGNIPDGSAPNKLMLRAYNFIYNEYFRDQNLKQWVDLDDSSLKYGCWEKDYYTSALPFQQRGTLPAIPLSGVAGALFDTDDTEITTPIYARTNNALTGSFPSVGNPPFWANAMPFGGGVLGSGLGTTYNLPSGTNVLNYAFASIAQNPNNSTMSTGSPVSTPLTTSLKLSQEFVDYLNIHNMVDFDTSSAIDINLMRLGFQTQKWKERNARAGARYTEQLKARFNETAGDARLDRPEFLGGTKTPVIISEVLQTAQNTTTVGGQRSSQLGTMAGHGITADESKIGTYRVKEHGVIITLLCVRPDTSYSQGIDLKFTRRTRHDFLTPEFVNLSEQAVANRELYLSTDESYNEETLGFQGRYNEYRYSKNKITGLMRTDFAFWNLSRIFSDTNKPSLNNDFVECHPDKRIFAVPSEPGIFLNYGAINDTVRPLPIFPEPGLIDHH